MPHEIIMPALGMAQDSGLIVAWHKAAGEAVAADEVLFEVETDKATMEVPAGADGFVTQIRHPAGAEVPVGEVIAVIGESAEDAAPAPELASEPAPDAAAPAGEAAPEIEGAEVIMPALGMAQDTGLIVAWHKAPGEAVGTDEVLFEVETDKATMEVAAGHDGYVAALYAEAGEEAPVGAVIAVISADKPAHPVRTSLRAASADKAPAKTPAPAPAAAPKPAPAPAAVKVAPAKAGGRPAPVPRRPAPGASGGPILASPKAKRLAAEQGLDLARLAGAGVPMPYHVADLETLRALPDATAAETAPAGGPAQLHVSARVPRAGFAAFSELLAEQAGREAALAGFAAASLRAAAGAATGALTVRVDRPLLGRALAFRDPDLGPISAATAEDPAADGRSADLILRELTGSRITGGTLGAGAAPALSIAAAGDDYVLTLDFAADQLDADAAVALLDGFAGRLEEPLRHLL